MKTARGLDYGGGYGMFVRLMRDRGWDFALYEPNAPNLFAGPFVISDLSTCSGYDVVTAFEVVEHLVRPLDGIREWLRLGRVAIVSTQLVPEQVGSPEDWWYFGLHHGQHISLLSAKTLLWLGDTLSCAVYSTGGYHLFVPIRDERGLLTLRCRFFLSRYGSAFAWNLFRRPSLLPADYFAVTGQSLK